MKHRVELTLVLLALTFAQPVKADESLSLSADRRLDHLVTIQRGRVYLGELIGELQRQIRVPLSVSDTRGPVDGIDLTCFVTRRPAREVMQALPTLFAHKADVWEWRAEKDPSKGYRLVHQRSPEEAAAASRALILQEFGRSLREYHRLAQLADDQRETAARSHTDLFPVPPGQPPYIQHGQMDLFRSLTPASFEALLRGELAPINPAGQSQRATEALTLGISPQPVVPEQERVAPGFLIRWDESTLGPMMWLRADAGMVNAVGGGTWDADYLKRSGAGWWFAGQAEVDEYAELTRQRPLESGTPGPQASLAAWLKAASKQQGLNVIADGVYSRGNEGFATWFGRTPRQTALALVVRARVTARQTGEIYLIRDKTAPVHPRLHLVPWKTLNSLRRTADSNEGFLPLADLLKLARLTDPQRRGLVEEFPQAKPILAQALPVLEFYSHLEPNSAKKLLSPEGLPIRDSGLVARAALASQGDPTKALGLELLDNDFDRATVALRIVQDKDPFEPDTLAQRFTWEVRVPDKPLHRFGGILKPRKPLQPE